MVVFTRNQGRALACALVAVPVLALAVAGVGAVAGQSDGEVGPAEISFMVDNEGAQTNEFWQGLIDRFNELHPDVSVTLVNPPSPGERDDYAKTLLASETFPDVAYLLNVTQFVDALAEWDTSDPDLAQLRNIDAQAIGGRLLSIGPGATPWNGIFYNKDMFSAAGIEAPPTTFEELDAALAALKASGVTPLVTAADWVPGFTFMATNDILAETPCWYARRWADEVSFSDQEWLDAGNRFASWVADGYFQDGVLGIDYGQAVELFRTGQVAMFPMGAWLTGDYRATPPEGFEAGWIPTPTRSGEVKLVGAVGSDAFTVSATSEHPEAARALVKFLAFDPGAVAAILDTGGAFPNVVPASGPIEQDLTPLGQEVAAGVAAATSFSTAWNGQGDCAPVPGTDSEAITGFAQELLLGEADVAAGLARIDEFWDANAST
jgi:ABC-type glycerol-3-phosphate transport system substrate-binding protein